MTLNTLIRNNFQKFCKISVSVRNLFQIAPALTSSPCILRGDICHPFPCSRSHLEEVDHTGTPSNRDQSAIKKGPSKLKTAPLTNSAAAAHPFSSTLHEKLMDEENSVQNQRTSRKKWNLLKTKPTQFDKKKNAADFFQGVQIGNKS